MSNKLFEQDGDSDDGKGLNINENYAGRYDRWREKEEYEKLKSKYGESAALNLLNDNGSDSSSTSESEDENGEGWTSDVDRDFFKTLASLKEKDPVIYNDETSFFSKKELVQPKKSKGKEKSMFLRDYERRLIVEKGGQVSDDEEAPGPSQVQTYSQEQEELKKDLKKVLEDSDSEGEDLLNVRKKPIKDEEKEDEEYKEWLRGQKKDINNKEMKKKLKPLKEFWSDPNLDENEKFLRDFILNKRHLETDDKDYIPTYEEVVHDSGGDLSEDERTLEEQTEFETKYNFRYEEPDPEFIKRYPRTIADSLRKTEDKDKRKAKRDEIKEKKLREKELKKEELKQLKKFKLNEIKEKLEQLKNITGNEALPFQDEDFDEDFDPDKHDQKMQEIFDNQYYDVDEGDQKPEFPFDEEIDDENWDEYTGGDDDGAGPSTSGYEPHCEDPDFNMDCDYDPRESNRQEMIALSNNKRNKSKRKSIFAQKVEAKKPVFDPQTHPKYEEYLEEYYKLDFEDIIGDMPVRFKYRKVVANDFGLDTEEILAARDKELNRWCSVKKTSQYRTENEELQDVHTFRTKKNNVNLKKKVLPSLFVENSEELLIEDQETARKKRRKNQGKEETDEQQPEAKRLKKEEGTKETAPSTSAASLDEDHEVSQVGTTGASEADDHQTLDKKKKKKKKKNKKKNKMAAGGKETATAGEHQKTKTSANATRHHTMKKNAAFQSQQRDYSLGMSDERLKAYGFNPKKFKNQQKFGKAAQK